MIGDIPHCVRIHILFDLSSARSKIKLCDLKIVDQFPIEDETDSFVFVAVVIYCATSLSLSDSFIAQFFFGTGDVVCHWPHSPYRKRDQYLIGSPLSANKSCQPDVLAKLFRIIPSVLARKVPPPNNRTV